MKLSDRLTINVSDKIIALLGEFRLGIIVAENIICAPSSTDLIVELNNTISLITGLYKLDGVNKIPAITSTRKAYQRAGNDPNRYRPSADSLIRRIVKNNDLYHINNVVDCLNLISIKSGYSIGGFDLSKIQGSIELGIGQKNEPYTGIGRGKLNIENLPVLRDDNGAFGTPTSDSERTMITSETTSVLFIFYDFGNQPILHETLQITCDFILRYCGIKKTLVNYQVQVFSKP